MGRGSLVICTAAGLRICRFRNELVAAGRAEAHHVHPESGWVSYFIKDSDDVARVIALFRLNYDRPWAAPREP